MTPKKPVDLLSLDRAVQLAESLHGIKNAPQRSGALQATVKDLREWCTGEYDAERNRWTMTAQEQAEWLVREARSEWDEWQGPRALQAIFDARFHPTIPTFKDWGKRPPVQCQKCEDKGTCSPFPGIFEWCDCQAAIEFRAEVPGWLNLLNGTAGGIGTTLKPAPMQEVIAEIERLKRIQNSNRKESQPPDEM